MDTLNFFCISCLHHLAITFWCTQCEKGSIHTSPGPRRKMTPEQREKALNTVFSLRPSSTWFSPFSFTRPMRSNFTPCVMTAGSLWTTKFMVRYFFFFLRFSFGFAFYLGCIILHASLMTLWYLLCPPRNFGRRYRLH